MEEDLGPHSAASSSSSSAPQEIDDKISEKRNRARRFLAVGMKLPLELQMVLCNRLFVSNRTLISKNDSEAAFRTIFRLYQRAV